MTMRTSIALGLLMLLPLATAAIPTRPDSTGLPGDGFDLAQAVELFRNSDGPEAFEQALNTEGNHVNNLDLDGDGQVDFVHVVTQVEGDAAAIVLRVQVSPTERQDVAVIGVEKVGPDSAVLQITGDEDLYPAGTIVEPFAEVERPATTTRGPSAPVLVHVSVVVNVWAWRPVPWFFGPLYRPYVILRPWGQHPAWWRPWHLHPWPAWWGWRVHHHHHGYRPWPHCRVVHVKTMYAPGRAHSGLVKARYAEAHQRHARTRGSLEAAPGSTKHNATKAGPERNVTEQPRKAGTGRTDQGGTEAPRARGAAPARDRSGAKAERQRDGDRRGGSAAPTSRKARRGGR